MSGRCRSAIVGRGHYERASKSTVQGIPRKSTVVIAPLVETIATPGAWGALSGGYPAGAYSAGDWAQIVTDTTSGLGYLDDWAQWDGAAWSGTYDHWVPGTSTGFARKWNSADVTFNTGTKLSISPLATVQGLKDCTIVVQNATLYGQALLVNSCVRCRFVVQGVTGMQAKTWRALILEGDTACYGNTYELTDVHAPGCVLQSHRSQRTVVTGSNVSGCSMIGDMGVVYFGGRDTMSRFSLVKGEFNVATLQTGLSMGSNVRNRIYLDDFSYGHTVGPLTLTADDGDYDVNIGGGSAIRVLTSGTHLNEDRNAFTTEYAAWFPGVSSATGVPGWIGPRSNAGQNTIA